MGSLTSDLLDRRRFFDRTRKFLLPAAIFFVAGGSIAAAFYFSGKKQVSNSSGQVAGAEKRVLPAEWLLKYFGTAAENDPKVGGVLGDPDEDLLTNQKEYLFGTNPAVADTDGDGVMDSFEVAFGQNPNGPGSLEPTADYEEQVKEFIASRPEYQDFTEEKIVEQFSNLLQPDRAMVMDFPQDGELVIIEQNDIGAFEQYFSETESLMAADEGEINNVAGNLFALSDEQLNFYLNKLNTTIDLLKKVPVPSQLLNIHRLKIAGLRAGTRMFELVRDDYRPEGTGQQLWADLFYQTVIAQNAGLLEVEAWRQIGLTLKDAGGL